MISNIIKLANKLSIKYGQQNDSSQSGQDGYMGGTTIPPKKTIQSILPASEPEIRALLFRKKLMPTRSYNDSQIDENHAMYKTIISILDELKIPANVRLKISIELLPDSLDPKIVVEAPPSLKQKPILQKKISDAYLPAIKKAIEEAATIGYEDYPAMFSKETKMVVIKKPDRKLTIPLVIF